MAGDGILVLDSRGTILVFNRACESLFGWSAQDVVGRSAAMLFDDANAPGAGPLGDRLRALAGTGREMTARHRDGASVPVEISLSEAETLDGPQFIAILRDLRPRREAEERFGQLQAELMHLARVSAMDQMGAALAHELNQPLTALTLYLQMLGKLHARRAAGADQTPPDPDLHRTLDEVIAKAMREAGRAGQIIQAMR
ncbi:MAG: PAS domain S-box protein, partial [Phreatobacter sp.]